MNNSTAKTVELNLSVLPAGNYEAETWSDAKNSDKEPKELKKGIISVRSPGTFKVTMAKNGGFIAIIKRKQ
jgi:alpha-glucosidase